MPGATPLPNTLGDVIQRIQGLMGDPTGRGLYTRQYLMPFVSQAYAEIAKRIKNATGKNLEAVIELLNVPAGTSNLGIYQSYAYVDPSVNPAPAPTRGPIAGLFDPIRLWVKTAGQLPQYYTLARGPRDTLPLTNPPGVTPGTYAVVVTFAWIGNKLMITPVAGPVDIRVYGRFNPPRLQKDEDELVIYGDMTDTLAAAAIAWTGIERSNTTILAGAENQAVAGVDNIVADLIRQSQREPRRTAVMCSTDRGGTWGFGNGYGF